MVMVEYAEGYQDALNDIADAITADGQRGALQWLESNLHDTPRRMAIAALLLSVRQDVPSLYPDDGDY